MNKFNKQVGKKKNTYRENISFSVIPMRADAITATKMRRPE